MKRDHSEYALHYVAHARRSGGRVTWFDVAAAYDAGLVHGINTNGPKREALARYMRALRIVNAARAGRAP